MSLPPISLKDVIDREPVSIDAEGIRTHLAERTILVTGAGGSIGAQLSEQIVDLAPERVVLVDVSEHNLYQLERRLHHLSYRSLSGIDLHLADVRDAAAMERVFRQARPDVVIHTAAYKHVPLMECHPYSAFQNNTLATARLLSMCEQHECEQFVFVSTDKAVQPKGVLGLTKRLAEWYVRTETSSSVACKVVRFGNVFGSRGSVVPLFEQQIRDGGPVTVTHPGMERYFMTADEACALILQTLLIASAPVFFFRMGDPVSIQHLAEVIVRRHTGTDTPDAFINYVGCRPGEKLREDLVMTHETPEPTSHPSIVGLVGAPPFSRDEMDARLDALTAQSNDPSVDPSSFQDALFDAACPPSSVTTATS